jgi:hypothetical protein
MAVGVGVDHRGMTVLVSVILLPRRRSLRSRVLMPMRLLGMGWWRVGAAIVVGIVIVTVVVLVVRVRAFAAM